MGEKTDAENNGDTIKATKHRSPNYPVIGLEAAVERVKALHEKYKRALVPIELSHQFWGFRPHSGTGNQTVAAIKAYGLLDVEGDGKSRKVRISDSAYRVLLGSPDRAKLLKEAAIAPPMHKEIWERFKDQGVPAELVKHYLLWDREDAKFNPAVVDGFIESFLGTLQYAKLLQGDIVKGEDKPAGDENEGETSVKIGDLVQWTVGGTDMFPNPRQVMGFSEDGGFAFVPGTDTGLPVGQLTVVGRAMTDLEKEAPQNPFKNTPPAVSGATGPGPRISVDLARGNSIEIRLKSKITRKELERIKEKVFALAELSFLVDDEAEDE